MRRNQFVLGGPLAVLLSCSGDGSGGASGTDSGTDTLTSTSSSTTTASGTSTSSTAGSVTGATDSGGSTAGTTDATTSAGSGPKFDIPMPDVGDEPPPVVGIPKTCAEALMTQSTVGCSFHANKMQNFIEEPTSVIIGNVSETNVATVQLYHGPGGVETAEGAPVMVQPLGTYEFVLNKPTQPGDVSVHRDGGAFRVETDIPVVAYQHSPISAQAHNDSSMLIPDHALGQFYIVAAWDTNIGSDRSAFNVVGIQDGTTVTWEPATPPRLAPASTPWPLSAWDRPPLTTSTCSRSSLAPTCPGPSSRPTSRPGWWAPYPA